MLGSSQGLVIIDEIQVMPELFRVLRVLVDRPGNKTRFLILGSASPDLVKNASETLAGRVEFIELSGLTLSKRGRPMLMLFGLGADCRVLISPAATETVSPGARDSFTPS